MSGLGSAESSTCVLEPRARQPWRAEPPNFFSVALTHCPLLLGKIKFIEAHRSVLAELFDFALPPAAIDTAAGGVAQFARRYGFLAKPLRIRLRLLDPALPSLPGCAGLPDITLDAASFAGLALPRTAFRSPATRAAAGARARGVRVGAHMVARIVTTRPITDYHHRFSAMASGSPRAWL